MEAGGRGCAVMGLPWGMLKLGWPFKGVPPTRQGAESLNPPGKGHNLSKTAPFGQEKYSLYIELGT